jgi:hypothetical protein
VKISKDSVSRRELPTEKCAVAQLSAAIVFVLTNTLSAVKRS